MQSQHVHKDFSEIEKLVSIMTFANHEEFSQEIRKKIYPVQAHRLQ